MSDYMDSLEARREKIAADNEDIVGNDFGYDYPLDGDGRPIDFSVGSEPSREIANLVCEYCQRGKRVIDENMHRWREMDWLNNGFMPADEWDEKVQKKDSRKPSTVRVPLTYQMKEIFLTYLHSVFFRSSYIHGYRGMSGKKSLIQAAKMQRIIARQSNWFREKESLDNFWNAAFSYGRTSASVDWKKRYANRTKVEEVSDILAFQMRQAGMDANPGDVVQYVERKLLAEGNSLTPLDNYNTFVDPQVPPNRIQESEFFGWIWTTNSMNLLRLESDEDNGIFNAKQVRELAKQGKMRSQFYTGDSGRGKYHDGSEYDPDFEAPGENASEVHITTMVVEIIPYEWKLGDDKTPQKYVIWLAGDTIPMKFDPLDNMHNDFPVVSCAPNGDGQSVVPTSSLHTIHSLQKFNDWLMKSRMDSVVTILNGTIFFDPSKVSKEDMMNPGMGKYVRVKNSAYDQGGVDRYVHQMQVQDVTAGHMVNIAEVNEMAKDGVGATDLAGGQLGRMPERPTKAGINAATSGTFGRLQRLATKLDECSMQDIAYQFAFNTIQYMSEETEVPLTGQYEQLLKREYGIQGDGTVLVTPFDFDDFAFDVLAFSHNDPNTENLDAMGDMLKTFLQTPEMLAGIAGEYRISELFAAYFRKIGFTDIHEFRQFAENGGTQNLDFGVMPDDQVMSEVEKGNLVPING